MIDYRQQTEETHGVKGKTVKKTDKRKIKMIAGILLLLVLSLLYIAADRYLFEHVQMENVSTAVTEETTDGSGDSTAASASSVSVECVETGSGEDKITYYVADIRIADVTALKSAFAEDSFGLNIIEKTSVIAEANNALFAVNGDYYGFRDDGIVIRNGIIYRDIPARTGLALYRDGSMKIYEETTTTASELLSQNVWNTLSFGPALLIDSEIPDSLDETEVDTNFGNHSIQGEQPRTAIGIIDNNHFIVIVVDGRSEGYSRGMTLPELAEVFRNLGCTDAYNLDGGGSSTMYWQGEVVNNPLGKNKERGTSDILFLAE